MHLSFWFACFGMLINLAGTVLLIFSLPASVKYDPSDGQLGFFTPGKGQSDLQFTREIFNDRVLTENNLSIRLSLSLLIVGVTLQIIGLYLDC